MKGSWICGLIWAASIALSVNRAAANTPPSLAKQFLKEASLVQLHGAVADWDKSLRDALRTLHNPVKVAIALSRRYSLAASDIAQLMELWFQTTIQSWDDREGALEEQRHRSLDRRYIALVRRTHHNPLVLAVAVEAINYIGRCEAETYRALIAGAPNGAAVAWRVVAQVSCTPWLAAFAAQYPNKAAAVAVQLGLDEELGEPESLTLSERLAGQYLRSHTSEADYQILRARFAYLHVQALWHIGFVQQGLDFFLSLPESNQNALTESAMAESLSVTVDGMAIEYPRRSVNLSFDLMAARYVLGPDSKSSWGAIPAVELDASRTLLHCWHDYVPADRDGGNHCRSKESLRYVALLDQAVLSLEMDPYDFVEYYYSQQFDGVSPPSRGSGLWTQALCKMLGGGRYSTICESARESLDPWGRQRLSSEEEVANEDAAHAALLSIRDTEISTRASAFEEALTAAFGPAPSPERARTRGVSIDPSPSPFVELPLPTSMRTSRGNKAASDATRGWPAAFGALPSGFSPVRVQRLGERVVAISVSQTLDPSGEVSAGGYWVHLSQDRGRTWEAPLYTGLAERFPYVVRAHSRLPILDGDTLNVEVDVEQLDTGSITYPPVALHSKRHARNLYLRIPLAVLRQDSDGDGIPDLVERHLLLNPNGPDIDGDGVRDGEDSMPNVPRNRAADPSEGAIAAVIERLFGVHSNPIIEGIDASGGSDALVKELASVRMGGDPLSREHPVFIEGNAADFATLADCESNQFEILKR